MLLPKWAKSHWMSGIIGACNKVVNYGNSIITLIAPTITQHIKIPLQRIQTRLCKSIFKDWKESFHPLPSCQVANQSTMDVVAQLQKQFVDLIASLYREVFVTVQKIWTLFGFYDSCVLCFPFLGGFWDWVFVLLVKKK